MAPKQRTEGGAVDSREVSVAERIAWYALLAVPAIVPAAASKIPFSGLAPLTFNLFVYPKIFAFAWLVGISLLAWGAGVLTGAIEMRTVPLRWWLAAFFGLAIVSTAFALSPMMSFFGGRYHAVGLLVFLLGGALYVLVTQLVTTMGRVRELSWSVVVGGVIIAGIGLLQVLGADPLGSVGPGFIAARGASLLGNPDFTGTYLVVPALLAAALALSAADWKRQALAGSAFVLTTAALVATLTRGAWIGLAVGLVALGVAYVRSGAKPVRRLYIALAALVALLLPILLILRDPTRALRQIADLVSGGAAGSGRITLWKEALAIVGRHPLFGTGPDAFRLGWYGVRTVASVRLTGLTTISEDPHNIVLLLAATIGIPAAIAAIGFIGVALYSSARAVFSKDVASARLVYAGWWAALAGLCVALVFATNTTPVVVALFSATGVLMAARSKPATWPLAARYALISSAAVLAIAALVISTLTITADATLMRAQTSPDKLAIAARAGSIAPWYTEARDQAMTGLDDAVLQEVQAGAPTAAADAALAEQRIRDFIASDPAEYHGYAELAHFLDSAAPVLGQDALTRAATAADSALQIYPVSSEAAFLKGTAELGLSDPGAAVRTLAPLWEVDPTYPNAGIVYAEALRLDGQQAKAASIAAVLEKRFPDNQDVARLLARLKTGSAK